MVELFLLTLLATIAAQLTPGPNFLAVAATALGQGRMAGIAVAAGSCEQAQRLSMLMSSSHAAVVLAIMAAVYSEYRCNGGSRLVFVRAKHYIYTKLSNP